MTIAAFKIDHIGIAVPDIKRALSQYADMFGYKLLRGPYDDPQQQARVAFIGNDSAGDPPLKLGNPAQGRFTSAACARQGVEPVSRLLRSAQRGTGIVHLRASGCLSVSGPTPAVAYDGRPIAWLYTPNRQLTELVEAPASTS